MTSVQAGEVEAVHEVTTANVHRQQLVEVEGQTDILTMGLPYICPYNVNSVMNPILVQCLGLGYFFNMYLGQPLVQPLRHVGLLASASGARATLVCSIGTPLRYDSCFRPSQHGASFSYLRPRSQQWTG